MGKAARVFSQGYTYQITVTGSTPGYCLDVGDWHLADGTVWVSVRCFDATHTLTDLPFDIAILGPPYGPIGEVDPVQPGPPPPGPRWGYAYMNAVDAPIGAETGLNPGIQWGTWLGTFDSYAARWLAQSTVTRESIGVSRVRLPNIGSSNGIPHVTVASSTGRGDNCAEHDFTQSGADELVRGLCYDGSGRPKDVRFHVFFGEPSTGGSPTATIRSDAPGDGVHITKLGPGSYRATLEGQGFDGTGYAQITPMGDKPVQCQNAGIAMGGAAMQIDVSCHTTGTVTPGDTEWLLTYVQRAPLSQDTREPGAYAQTTSGPNGLTVDETRSYTSSGGAITLVKEDTGLYRVRFAGIARLEDNIVFFGHTAQVVTLGSNPGHCRATSVNHQNWDTEKSVAEVQVSCSDAFGKAADVPFGVAVVRRP